jgi:hypothetical protein
MNTQNTGKEFHCFTVHFNSLCIIIIITIIIIIIIIY